MPGFLAEALTWPGNRHIITSLKTARGWGVPPLAIIFGKDDGWTELNRMMAQALTIVEEETCSQCKTPLWLAYGTDNRVQFKVDTSYCYACAELDKHRSDHKKKEQQPGEVVYVKPFNVIDGERLPTRRELYKRG
jgi:hypothetical protein